MLGEATSLSRVSKLRKQPFRMSVFKCWPTPPPLELPISTIILDESRSIGAATCCADFGDDKW
jgi:hypothetical protein